MHFSRLSSSWSITVLKLLEYHTNISVEKVRAWFLLKFIVGLMCVGGEVTKVFHHSLFFLFIKELHGTKDSQICFLGPLPPPLFFSPLNKLLLLMTPLFNGTVETNCRRVITMTEFMTSAWRDNKGCHNKIKILFVLMWKVGPWYSV